MDNLEKLNNKLKTLKDDELNSFLKMILSKFTPDELIKYLDTKVEEAYEIDFNEVKSFFDQIRSNEHHIICEYDYDSHYDYYSDDNYIYYGTKDLMLKFNEYSYLANKLYVLKDYERSYSLYKELINVQLEIRDVENNDVIDYVDYEDIDMYIDLNYIDDNYNLIYIYLSLVTKKPNANNIIKHYFNRIDINTLENVFISNDDNILNYKDIFIDVVNKVLDESEYINYKNVYGFLKILEKDTLDLIIKSKIKEHPKLIKEYIVDNNYDDNLIHYAISNIDEDITVRGEIASLSLTDSFLTESFISNPSLENFFYLNNKYTFSNIKEILERVINDVTEDDLRYDELLFKYLNIFNYSFDIILNYKYTKDYRTTGDINSHNLLMVIGLIMFSDDISYLTYYLSNKLNVNNNLMFKYFKEWKKHLKVDLSIFKDTYDEFLTMIEESMVRSKKAYYDEYSIVFAGYSYLLEKLEIISSKDYIAAIIKKFSSRRKLKDSINKIITML